MYLNKKPQQDFVNLVFAEWMLPGEWKTLEVVTNCQTSTTSYVMATKLHPNSKDYVDFWGNVNPYGPQKNLVFVNINEFAKDEERGNGRNRFSVTTGRHTHTDMSTTMFEKLDDAVKFAVNEMVKTTKKFDKIHKRKTTIWSDEALLKNDTITNTVQ